MTDKQMAVRIIEENEFIVGDRKGAYSLKAGVAVRHPVRAGIEA
jgi:hypothetical protein